MSDIFVGIDPGSSGAIAAIGPDRTVHVADFLPIIKVPKSPRRVKRTDKKTGEVKTVTVRGMKTEFDFSGVADLFDKVMFLPGVKTAVIEDIAAMPRDSTTAAFTFGGSFWALQMALADRTISYEKVKPKLWQGALLTGSYTGDPKALRKAYLAKARMMFPGTDLSMAKHAEVAAALLLAEYCRRSFVHGVPNAPVESKPAVVEEDVKEEVAEKPVAEEVEYDEDLDMSVDDPVIEDEENEI